MGLIEASMAKFGIRVDRGPEYPRRTRLGLIEATPYAVFGIPVMRRAGISQADYAWASLKPRRAVSDGSQDMTENIPGGLRLGLIEAQYGDGDPGASLRMPEYPRRIRLGLIEATSWWTIVLAGHGLEYPGRTHLGLIEAS